MRPAMFLLGIVVITILAAALRLFRLGMPSMWVDELFTVFHVAREPGIDYWLRPLAYLPTQIGLWLQGIDLGRLSPGEMGAWRAMGVDEATLRLPSAVIGIASIPILGWLTQRLVDRRTALIFTALLAVATWHLWMSQSGRFYVQQILLYNVCLILYYDGVTRRSPRTLAACGVFFLLAFMTQMTSPMILGVFAVEAVIRQWQNPGRRVGQGTWLLLGVAVLLCGGVVGWWYRISDFSASTHSAPVIVAGTVWLVGVPVALFAGCTAVWMWRRNPRLTGFLVASALMPVVTLIVLGWLGANVHTRYACPSMYGWLLLAAIGLSAVYDKLRQETGPALAAAPLALVISASLVTDLIYYTGGYGHRPRWREAISYIEQHRRDDEQVLADYVPYHQARYYLGSDDIQRLPFALSSDDLARLDAPAWIVLHGSAPTVTNRATQLPQGLDLKAYFSHRTFQPYSSVHVYYFDAAASMAAARAAEGEPTPPGNP
ncbi:MAG: glycosyltransferase family 39 protein [Phycisphaeraceae bacterium]